MKRSRVVPSNLGKLGFLFDSSKTDDTVEAVVENVISDEETEIEHAEISTEIVKKNLFGDNLRERGIVDEQFEDSKESLCKENTGTSVSNKSSLPPVDVPLFSGSALKEFPLKSNECTSFSEDVTEVVAVKNGTQLSTNSSEPVVSAEGSQEEEKGNVERNFYKQQRKQVKKGENYDLAVCNACKTISPDTLVVLNEENFRINSPRINSYQVVARRYRPQTFSELIGQEIVARALSNAIETNRVGHAYLFTGARGVGKTSCARIFAKALNCVNGPTTHPCLKCDSCVEVALGDDIDVLEIDGASNRGVDEIRQLRQNATISPTRSLYKIYIIDEVHMLTREAFNALLKTLEEPPARVKFILCTTEPNKIPITILSRCQRFDFSGISCHSIVKRLSQIVQQEGASVEDGVFEILARRANGSMRDAQSLLEQLLSFAPRRISQSDVHCMFGSVDDDNIFVLLDVILHGNASRVFELLGNFANQGVDFGILIEQIIGVYRDLLVIGCGCGADELMYSSIGRLPEIRRLAENLGVRRILATLQILEQASQRMRISPQSRIIAELTLVRLCNLDSFQVLEKLIAQIQQGQLSNLQSLFNSSASESDEPIKKK